MTKQGITLGCVSLGDIMKNSERMKKLVNAADSGTIENEVQFSDEGIVDRVIQELHLAIEECLGCQEQSTISTGKGI